jgi:hypothetical protein
VLALATMRSYLREPFASLSNRSPWHAAGAQKQTKIASAQFVERFHPLGLRDDPRAIFRDDVGARARPMTNGLPHLLGRPM